MNLSNRTVVVTGASKGLGREIALRLHHKQANVILVARSTELIEQTGRDMAQAECRPSMAITCDISNEENVRKMAETIRSRYDHVDALVNNAGIGIYKTVEELSTAEMQAQFAVNMHGPFYCIKALLPLLKKSDSGYILNIGSLFSKTAFADNSVYAATKHALSGFSAGLRQDMKKHGIKVGLFMPGPMNTSFQDHRGIKATRPRKLITLSPARAAEMIEKMIVKRKKVVYMYRWILVMMKAKQFLAS